MRDRPRSRRRRRLWLALAGVACALGGALAGAWFASPTPTALDPRVAAHLRGTGGRAISLDAVSPVLQQAVVATEDERFYRHRGIDLIGVLRALPYDLVHLSLAQGASTITEQVAKLLYLGGNDHAPWRKLEDAAVALKLEDRYSKKQILAAYLNSAYFGVGTYGVWAASERYFGILPRRLDTAQASLLAGLIQAPSAYDPFRHPDLARARQADVLRSLVRNGDLTQAEAAATLARPLHLRGGSVLPAVRGIDFAPGPAFIWWQLALGAVLALTGGALFTLSRRSRFRPARGLYAVKALSIVAVVLGFAEVVRSFRSA